MKHSTYYPAAGDSSTVDDSSPDTSTIKTLTPPQGTSACLISVETTNARMTFDGSDPAAGNGHVFPKDQVPALFLLGPGSKIKWTSTAGAASVVVVTWLS